MSYNPHRERAKAQKMSQAEGAALFDDATTMLHAWAKDGGDLNDSAAVMEAMSAAGIFPADMAYHHQVDLAKTASAYIEGAVNEAKMRARPARVSVFTAHGQQYLINTNMHIADALRAWLRGDAARRGAFSFPDEDGRVVVLAPEGHLQALIQETGDSPKNKE